MTAEDLRIVHLRVDRGWVLELRIRILPAEVRETADLLARQPTADDWVIREPGDTVRLGHVGQLGAERELAALEDGYREAEVDQARGGQIIVKPSRDLLVEYPHVSVRVSS